MTFCGIEIRANSGLPANEFVMVSHDNLPLCGGNIETGETWFLTPDESQRIKAEMLIVSKKIEQAILKRACDYSNIYAPVI